MPDSKKGTRVSDWTLTRFVVGQRTLRLFLLGWILTCGCDSPIAVRPAAPTESEVLSRFNSGHVIYLPSNSGECRMLGDFVLAADGAIRWRVPGAVSFLISVPHSLISPDPQGQIVTFVFADPDGSRVNCSGGEITVIRGEKLTHIMSRHRVMSSQTTRGDFALEVGSHSASGYSEIMEIRFVGEFERKK